MSLTGEDNNINKEMTRSSSMQENPPAKPVNPRTTAYRECLKNHAANVGGNVTDGCGEFMPSGEDGTLEALKCAACSCHRNFHRKEVVVIGPTATTTPPPMAVHPLHLPPSVSHHHQPHHWVVHPMKMAYGGGGGATGSIGTDSSSEELMNFNDNSLDHGRHHHVAPPPPQFGGSKKRFRTKFTAEQKTRMLQFAEKLGWRIPREDDTEVQRFCAEVGVKRQVFKVWMHNNKGTAASGSSSNAAKKVDHHSVVDNPQEF